MSVTLPEQMVSPSTSVIEEVATREGVDPTELDQPLYHAIDPDALDTLVRSSADAPSPSSLSITFTYHGYEVSVSSDGVVDLERREAI